MIQPEAGAGGVKKYLSQPSAIQCNPRRRVHSLGALRCGPRCSEQRLRLGHFSQTDQIETTPLLGRGLTGQIARFFLYRNGGLQRRPQGIC